MTHDTNQLERLISRFLDGEAAPAERRALNDWLERDQAARALYEEYAALDRAAGYVLRRKLGRPRLVASRERTIRTVGRLATIAVAACLAIVVWIRPDHASMRGGNARTPHVAGSLLGTALPAGDFFEAAPLDFERPNVRVNNTLKDFILIPGSAPGEYLLIEVKRTQTRLVGIQGDL